MIKSNFTRLFFLITLSPYNMIWLVAGEGQARRSILKTPESTRGGSKTVTFQKATKPEELADDISDNREEYLAIETHVYPRVIYSEEQSENVTPVTITTRSPKAQVTVPIKLTKPEKLNTPKSIQVHYKIPDVGEQPDFNNYVLNSMRELIKNLTNKTLGSHELRAAEAQTLSSHAEQLFAGLNDPNIIAYRTTLKKKIKTETKKQALKKLAELKPLFTELYTTIEHAAKNPEKQIALRQLLQAFYAVDIDTRLADSTEQALNKLQNKLSQEAITSYQELLDRLNDPDILVHSARAQDKLETLVALFIKIRDQLEKENKSDLKLLKENLNILAQKFYGTSVRDLEMLPALESKAEWSTTAKIARNNLKIAQSALKKIKYIKKEEFLSVAKKLENIVANLEKISTAPGRLKLLASLKLALKKTGIMQNKLKEKIAETKKKLPSMNNQTLKSLFQADLETQKQLALAANQVVEAVLAKLPPAAGLESQASTAEAVQDLALGLTEHADRLFELVSAISPRAMAS